MESREGFEFTKINLSAFCFEYFPSPAIMKNSKTVGNELQYFISLNNEDMHIVRSFEINKTIVTMMKMSWILLRVMAIFSTLQRGSRSEFYMLETGSDGCYSPMTEEKCMKLSMLLCTSKTSYITQSFHWLMLTKN